MGLFGNKYLEKKIEELKDYVDSKFRHQQREIEAKRYFLPKEDEFEKRLSDLEQTSLNETQEASINMILEKLDVLEKKQNELENFMQKKLKKSNPQKNQKEK